MGLFDTPDDNLRLDPKAVQQSLSRLNSMRHTAPPAPPAPVAPKERGLFGETAAAVKRGGLQVLDMAGNIAKAIDPEGGVDVVRNTGAGLSNYARNRAAQPDVAESSYVQNHSVLGNIPKAMEMAVPSVGIPLAAAGGAVLAGASAPVTAAVGVGAPALAFGVSQFQDTKERGLAAGLSPEEANRAGLKTGAVEAGLESASSLIPFSKVFKLAKPVQGTVLKSMFKSPTWKALGRKLAVDTAQIMGGEVSTEMGQAYLQAKAEKDAGIRPDANPGQEAKDVIGPTIGLSLITGGVVGGANKLSRVASQRALQNPGVHEDVRRAAMESVHAGLVDAENKGIAPAGSADNWRRNVEAAIKVKAPLVLSDDLLTTDRTAAQESHDEQVKNDALEALALAADPTNDLGVSDAVQVVNQRKAEEVVSRVRDINPVVAQEPLVGETQTPVTTPEPIVTPEPVTPEPAALAAENETPAPDPFESRMSTAVQDGGVALSKRGEGPTPEMVQWAESKGFEFTPGKLMRNMEQRWWGLQPKQAQVAPQEVSPSPVEQAQVAPQEPTSAATHTPPPAGQYRQHVVQRDEQGRPLVVAVERPDGVVGLLNTKGGVTAAFENATDPDHPYIQAYREAVARGEVEQGPAPNAAFVKGTQQFDGLLQEVAAQRITPRKETQQKGPADGTTGSGFAKRSLKGFEKWPAARRLAVLNTHYRNARGESLPAGSFRESGNRALRDSLAKVARIFGHDVTLMERGPDGMPAGFTVGIDRKNIYIQEGVSDHPLAILGHEMVHQMKASDPALFDELAKGLMALRNDPAMEMYLQAFDTVDASTIEEWVADVFGNSMTREGFWSEFEKASPSLAGRVAKFVNDLITKFKDKLLTGRTGLAAQTIKDFRAVERLTAEVARRYAENMKRYESGEMSEAGFKELSSVSSDDIPSHIVNAVAAPREVMTAVSTATKQQTKDTLNEKLKSREIPHTNPIRLTTVEELHDIIKTGTLRAGKDFEGRSGISAQLVDGKKPIVAYGPNDKISAAIVFPEQAAIGKGMAPNEVKVSEKTDVTDLHFVVDGFRELMSFDQLKEAMGEKQDAIGFKELSRTDTPQSIIVDGVERSTVNSLGNPIASNLRRIENFWRWFGDSQAIDEQGRPQVVYHTSSDEFDAFRRRFERDGVSSAFEAAAINRFGKGIFFSSSSDVSENFGSRKPKAFYLKIDDLNEVNLGGASYFDGTYYDPETGEKWLDDNGNPLKADQDFLPDEMAERHLDDQDKYNSGVVVRGIYERIPSKGKPQPLADTWIVGNPRQIKSVENNGEFNAGSIKFKELTAWHGSPHDFSPERRIVDKNGKVVWRSTDSNESLPDLMEGERVETAEHGAFNTRKIGTGEGAQAYGYGLYFAGNRAVAEYYRESLTDAKFDFDEFPADVLGYWNKYRSELMGLRVENGALVGSKKTVLRLKERAARAADKARVFEQYGDTEAQKAEGRKLRTEEDELLSLAEFVKSGAPLRLRPGRLYQVELAPKEDEYLLWDKPLSEQSDKVREALKKAENVRTEQVLAQREETRRSLTERGEDTTIIDGQIEILKEEIADPTLPGSTGEEYYRRMAGRGGLFNGQKEASEYLHSLGIRGIKYLDGSSRGKGDGNYNYVIFDDNDVTITFKELTSLNPKEQASGINRSFRDIPYGRVLKDAMKSAYRFFMPMDRTVNLLASMANYKPIQTQLKQFLSQRKGKAGYLRAAMTNAHHVIKTMGKAFTTEADEKKLADLAFTATLYQVHADPRMADGWTEDTWVTSGQDQVTGKSLGDVRREVRSMYSRLTPKQKKAHRAMLDHFQHLRDDAKNHALDPVKQLFGDDVFAQAQQYLANEQQIVASGVEVPQLVRDAAKAIKTKMQAFPELKGDYVPLMRFGNYQVRINEVDENGEMGKRTYAEFFDTKEDALRFIAGINQNTATSGQMATLEVADDKLRRAHVNVPGSYADQIKDALSNKYKEALESGDADTQALIESMIEAAHDEAQAIRVNTLPRTTTEGSKLHREGVAGFSRDIVKVFATFSRNNALANSRLIYGEQINQTFRDMKNTIKAFDSEPSEPGQEKQHALMSADMQDAYNWLYRMDKEGDQEKVHELAQVLGKASAFWYLSSPSTWLVQWSQPFIFTVPHMAARFGFPKALAEYTRAAKRYMAGNYSDEKIDEFDRTHEFVGKRMADLIEQSRTAPERERRRINAELKSIYESFPDPKDREMLALKVLSHQNAVDLSAAHMVQDLTAGATDGTKAFDKLVNGSAWFMQHSESGSRRAAAVSSFNMAFGKDGDFLKANDYAVDTISKTLYDFDSSNRGEAWRGSWGRVFGIFRFFQLHTIGQITQLSKDALGAEFKRDIAAANGDQARVKEATDRMREARKELAYIMGSSFALAGALGTPLSTLFSNSAMNLIWAGLGLAFGDDDDPWDPRRDFEMMVRKNLNSTAADVVLKGLPSLVGADVSRRIGLGTVGDLINGEPPPGISSAQKFGWYAGRALGPAGGMVMDGVRVMDELEKGNLVEAIRYGTPKGIRDMVKAFQVASEGVKSGGNTILKGEDVSPYSYALMFMGVNPLDVSLAQEESRYLKNISAVLSQRRSGLVKDLAEAVVNQDEDAKAAAVEEINGWQQAHPKLQITMQNVVQAIKRRQKAEENVPTKREQIIQEEYGMEGGEDGGEM